MNIRQRLYSVFIYTFIWGGLIGCIAIAINSKTQSLVSSGDRHIAVEAHSSSMEQQLAKHAQSLVAAIAVADRQIAVSTIASIAAAIVSVRLIYRSSLKSLERSQTVEQSERDDSARQAEIVINKEKEIEAKLTKINRCLLSFCTDPSENINQLTSLLGELLGASCTLYSFLDNGRLRAVGQWQTPSEFERVNRTEGRICHDLIQQNSDEIWVLSDLLTTKYAQSEPSIQAHNIKTYIGKVVKCQQQVVGCLSAWYTIEYMPSEIDRKIIDIIAAAIGIEEERRATQRSLQDEQRYALAAQAARDGLWDWNLNTDRIYLSKRSQLLMDLAAENSQTSAAEFFQRIHPADLNTVQTALGEHLAERTPQFESEYRITLADGSDRWLLFQGLAWRDAEGKPYRIAGSQTDITERKQAEVQLRYQAYHDEQTGLPNRILLMERLRRAIDKQKHQEDYLFAVLFLDLDRFKVINDSLGHGFGDRMLKAIASRLQTCVRPGDTIARLGGDEFTLLLEAIGNEQEALQIAERIQQRIALPFYLGEHEVFASASIGIALSRLDYEDPEDLLRDADTAMHRAKTLGTRMEIFDSSMHNLAMARLQIEIDLRKALERQELRVFYQPIVSLKTGKTTGFEALVRWQHPTSGMIPPIKFIPVAEETGLICAIGWWVLQQACHQTRHWQERFPTEPPLTISVNVSGKQFTQSNLIEKVDRILQETGLAPTSLKLEITESVLVENAEAAAAVICQLRAMGIQFSIDDFGTGYSSLSYLHRLPIDTLKIDRSFVNNVDCEPEKIEIIRTIVALAWNLGMNVVAEGVETKTQMYQLQALKSEYGQGYFFSKPTDSEAAEALLMTQPDWEQDLRAMAQSVQGKRSKTIKP
ncbi:EAL domain-containing protein [Chroococcidiopsis sp. FACHB-1243]|uniref:putative bifunctional diguanylate cyclase/phosphodiesterase n=1 Tax=Chroococcidiopsis sp. [FACHB-1243] TaxID=2692781 RepID=UPI00177C60CB|nr:GGDEF domain-containing phosphodiesterase [Chroococcidiopsis sp. [FACHB-1243]]MBD2308180.1 EAL domain-containing protein [Chroococcidiopsis sp. [FACHB-1243]]